MSRKVNLSVLLSATLQGATGIAHADLEDRLAEGILADLPGVESADVEDVVVEHMHLAPDNSRVSMGLDILIRADYDADWGLIQDVLEKNLGLDLDEPVAVSGVTVAVAVTDSR